MADTSNPQHTGAGRAHRVDAVVFVPGLRLGLNADRSFAGVAARIRDGCDRQSPSRSQRFAVTASPIDLRDDVTVQSRVTLEVTDSNGTRSVADLFEFDWSDELTNRWEAQSGRQKLSRSLFGFLVGLWVFLISVVAAIRRRSLRRAAQAGLALAALLAVFAYLVGLIAAAFTVLSDWIDGASTWSTMLQQVVLVVTAAIAVFVPKLRNKIPGVGIALLAAHDYLNDSIQSRRIAGSLIDLIEAMAESERYGHIYVVAYSMGGIVAIDAVFPAVAPPVRTVSAVSTLVTIAPPFEPVAAVRRDYLGQRHAGTNPNRWLNYWAEVDLLSSAKPPAKGRRESWLRRWLRRWSPRRSGDRTEARTAHGRLDVDMIEPIHYGVSAGRSVGRLLSLVGLSSHGNYWGADGDRDLNVFDQIVVDLGLVAVDLSDVPERGPLIGSSEAR